MDGGPPPRHPLQLPGLRFSHIHAEETMVGVEDVLTEAEIFERLEKAEKEVVTSINDI